MRGGMRHKAVLVLGCVVMAFGVSACGDTLATRIGPRTAMMEDGYENQ